MSFKSFFMKRKIKKAAENLISRDIQNNLKGIAKKVRKEVAKRA